MSQGSKRGERKQIAEKEGTGNREGLRLNFEVNKEDKDGFFLKWYEI